MNNEFSHLPPEMREFAKQAQQEELQRSQMKEEKFREDARMLAQEIYRGLNQCRRGGI